MVGLALLTGCATKTQYIEVRPECEVPPLPALPAIEWDDLLAPFNHIPSQHDDWRRYDEALTDVEGYEATLVDSLAVHREMLKILCQPDYSGEDDGRTDSTDNQ